MKQLIRRFSRVADSSQYHPLQSAKNRSEEYRSDVPEGHVPVYVGEEMERFVVPAELLGRPAFVELLRQSAQEYGYEQRGVLRIPCPVPIFRRVLQFLGSDGREEVSAVEIVRSFPEEFRSLSQT